MVRFHLTSEGRPHSSRAANLSTAGAGRPPWSSSGCSARSSDSRGIFPRRKGRPPLGGGRTSSAAEGTAGVPAPAALPAPAAGRPCAAVTAASARTTAASAGYAAVPTDSSACGAGVRKSSPCSTTNLSIALHPTLRRRSGAFSTNTTSEPAICTVQTTDNECTFYAVPNFEPSRTASTVAVLHRTRLQAESYAGGARAPAQQRVAARAQAGSPEAPRSTAAGPRLGGPRPAAAPPPCGADVRQSAPLLPRHPHRSKDSVTRGHRCECWNEEGLL